MAGRSKGSGLINSLERDQKINAGFRFSGRKVYSAGGETQRSCDTQMTALVKDCDGYRFSSIQVIHPEYDPSTNILTRIPWPKALGLFFGQRSEQHFSLSACSRGASKPAISSYVLLIDKPVHDSTPHDDGPVK